MSKIYDDFFKSINFDIGLLKQFKKIYVLVTGGMDSTLLWEYIHSHYPFATPVNFWNPYETNAVLTGMKNLPGFVEIKPVKKVEYAKIMDEAFLQLPNARRALAAGKYSKTLFPCCYFFKHKLAFRGKLLKDEGSCVISGIKAGDGRTRRIWTCKLRKRDTFIHRHKTGQTYVYPLRDYWKREFPREVQDELRVKYPGIGHTGCYVCPVLVLFEDRRIERGRRYDESLRKAASLGVGKGVLDELR